MQMKNSIKKLAIIELLVFIGWCSVVLIFADYDRAGFYFWGGFSFGVISFIAAGVSLLLIKTLDNENTTEINYIPVYYTSIFLFITTSINTYFAFRGTGKYNIVLVVLNLVILIGFIAIRLDTDDYAKRVDKQTKHSAEKIKPVTSISSQMSALISATTDPDIKKQLHKLKENVDYSSNVSQKFLEDPQNLFLLQLNQIQDMIVNHKNKDEINMKIQEATVTWNTRNSLASTIK